ncbi:MAG: ABC transporter ATP-binding protein [Candidatus Aenigmarchaeota archaeon]|nr:ABC transporter ATP-binding protein [Candidatus Aenigmarchaeota archaeon]
MHAIDVAGVSKAFRDRRTPVWALKDVDLHVREGEIFGLLGPNGAGKTTLLNIMIRLLLPDQGTVRILGEDVVHSDRILEQVNFVSGDAHFHWVLRPEDVLQFYARAYHLPTAVREERIPELMRFFGLERVRHRRFVALSTGERMRLVFAKAMLNRPRVLLLDEPTLGLDPSIAQRVRAEVARVNRAFKTTILLTSHYMHEVEQLADRIAFINQGQIVDTGTVRKVTAKHFGSYEAVFSVRRVLDRAFLTRHGFRVTGNVLSVRLRSEEDLSPLLSLLHRKGYQVVDVQTRKPTLEDYFVKVAGGKP